MRGASGNERDGGGSHDPGAGLTAGPPPIAPTEATAESALVPGPLSVVAEEGQIAGEASALGEVAASAPTEATAESALVPGPLSVVADEGQAESSVVPGPLSVVAEEGQIAGEASALGAVAPSAPTEPTAESSLVLGPLSVVADERRIAGEVSALGEVAPSAPTEPTAVAGERKDNSKQTAQNDQPAPTPIPPTEPTLAACQMPSPTDERPEMTPELAAIYRRLLLQAQGREMTARELDLCRRLLARARPPTGMRDEG